MAAEEAVEAGGAERSHVGERLDRDVLAVMGVDVVEHALDAQRSGVATCRRAAAGPAMGCAPSVESSASTCMRRKSRSGGGRAGSASTSGRARPRRIVGKDDAAPGAFQHRRDGAHLGERRR